jgi:chromosome segregation ATPase
MKNENQIHQNTNSNSLFNDDDINFEIESSQNIHVPNIKTKLSDSITPNTINNEKPEYISKLEQKIRDQAKRLSSLEKYKYLCEKRIKQLSPNHPLPITEEMLNVTISNDIINSEESKNYYDLLKTTIENDLIKNGLLNNYITSENIIDLGKIKVECEEYRKQLVLAQSMINSLKSDVEELTKELENKNKINEGNDINELNNKIEALLNEKENLLFQISEMKNENSKLKTENININMKLNEICKSDNQIEDVENKLNEYKNLYEDLNANFEALQKENIFLKKENNNYHSQIYSLEVQIDKLNSDINNQREKLINDDYKKMYSELLT